MPVGLSSWSAIIDGNNDRFGGSLATMLERKRDLGVELVVESSRIGQAEELDKSNAGA